LQHVATISQESSKSKLNKARAAMKWIILIQQFTEDQGKSKRAQQVASGRSQPPATSVSSDVDEDSKALNLLVDTINNCSEALAHQRLTARFLAARNQQLEHKLGLSSSEPVNPEGLSVGGLACSSCCNNASHGLSFSLSPDRERDFFKARLSDSLRSSQFSLAESRFLSDEDEFYDVDSYVEDVLKSANN